MSVFPRRGIDVHAGVTRTRVNISALQVQHQNANSIEGLQKIGWFPASRSQRLEGKSMPHITPPSFQHSIHHVQLPIPSAANRGYCVTTNHVFFRSRANDSSQSMIPSPVLE